jgi:hypothetical protein
MATARFGIELGPLSILSTCFLFSKNETPNTTRNSLNKNFSKPI